MSEDYGWAVTTRHVSKTGLEYIIFKWEGGNFCRVSYELVREGGPYIHGTLFGDWLYVGPYKLRITRWNEDGMFFSCYRDPDSLHNRIVPKIYPVYVRWIEFWRWIGSYWSIQ